MILDDVDYGTYLDGLTFCIQVSGYHWKLLMGLPFVFKYQVITGN